MTVKKSPSLSDALANKKEEDNKGNDTVVEDNDTVVEDNDTVVESSDDIGGHAIVETPTTDGTVRTETAGDEKNINEFQDPIPGPGLINKTPADLAAETPAETALRYGISSDVPDHVSDNPNVLANKDMGNFQIPGGTHLHPDVARDNFNRSVGGRTEHGAVTRNTVELVFAAPALQDDKGRLDAFLDETGDRDEAGITGPVANAFDAEAEKNNNRR